MRRREFFKLLGGIAAGWPLTTVAQQQAGKLRRIGRIQTEPSELAEAFSQGLREAGYVDRQNIILETRYHHGSLERIDEFARELVALKCSVIVAGSRMVKIEERLERTWIFSRTTAGRLPGAGSPLPLTRSDACRLESRIADPLERERDLWSGRGC